MHAATLSAVSAAIGTRSSVVFREGMSTYAMGLSGALRRRGIATEAIDLPGNGFHMRRIDAVPDPAEVIYLKIAWNGTHVVLVGEAVCSCHRLLRLDPKRSVAVVI